MHGFNQEIIRERCGLIQPKNRIGGESGDAQIIKDHEFFRDIDWDKLTRKELTPPFIPDVEGPGDFKYASHDLIREFLMQNSEDKFPNSGLDYYQDYSFKKEDSTYDKIILPKLIHNQK